jgi:hypothetical protein
MSPLYCVATCGRQSALAFSSSTCQAAAQISVNTSACSSRVCVAFLSSSAGYVGSIATRVTSYPFHASAPKGNSFSSARTSRHVG